jgi:1-deoxy-D-xylulose-5-phosphate synthase
MRNAILPTITDPAIIRTLSIIELQQLAQEIQTYILTSVSQTGGHLASNLGTIELTLALHYTFQTPVDSLIWDTGHQTYTHKIITGRMTGMSTLRQYSGMSGFTNITESVYDVFGAGHSSTAISAALGILASKKLLGDGSKVVVVVGDGALSAGLAFEGLNNILADSDNLVIILNDNAMSISENVGNLSQHLTHLKTTSLANFSNNIFTNFGLHYSGPVDGHNLSALIHAIDSLTRQKKPTLLHVITQKGHGYSQAVADPITYHGVAAFNPAIGVISKPSIKMTYTQIFGMFLCDMAAQEHKFVVITPAMREGSGLCEFAQRFPLQFVDVGIAEQHALTFAAGIAVHGTKAVVAIYSTFLQRGYDQLIHDIALQRLPVLLAIDRAGIVGADGATHHGAFDLSFLRCIPNLVIMAPSDELECYNMLLTGLHLNLPAAVRYPRGYGTGITVNKQIAECLPFATAKKICSGSRIVFFAFGSMVSVALTVAHSINATAYDMRFIKPLDLDAIRTACSAHEFVVTIEENVIMGGAGSGCIEAILAMGFTKPILQLGLPDEFLEHGDQQHILHTIGLDAAGVTLQLYKRGFLSDV